MPSLAEVPEEIVLEIGKYLDVPALLDLSLTLRQFRRVAQELLLHDVELKEPPQQWMRNNRRQTRVATQTSTVALFLRTLQHQPQFAAFVKALNLNILTRTIEDDWNMATTAYTLPDNTAVAAVQPKTHLWEPDLAALILAMLPNLQSLVLRLAEPEPLRCGNGANYMYPMTYHMDSSFLFVGTLTGPSDNPGIRLASIPGYRNLKRLEMSSRHLTHDFPTLFTLPAMQYLKLGTCTGSFNRTHSIPPNQIPFLEFSCAWEISGDRFGSGPWDTGKERQLTVFLKAFVALETLKATYGDCALGAHSETTEDRGHLVGSYQNFIKRVSPIHNRIEILDLQTPENVDTRTRRDLLLVLPATSFGQFTRLRILSINQGALLGHDRNGDNNANHIPPSIESLFPSTLEELNIGNTDRQVLPWVLTLLRDANNHFKNFTKVNIVVDGFLKGTDPWNLESEVRKDLLNWYRLECTDLAKASGVRIGVRLFGKDMVPGWEQEMGEHDGVLLASPD